MVSPVVSKIRCYNPNDKKSKERNREYLKYIATREGVDLTPLDELKDGYPLFGNFDCKHIKNTAKTIENMTKQGINVYRGLVSLNEKDAISHGYDSKQYWADLLKKVMPDIAKEFDIPLEHLKWTAAVHMEKGHPHCHYMFWSSKPIIKDPFITIGTQNKCRELFSTEIFRQEREQLIIDKTAARDLIIDFGKNIMADEKEYLVQRKIPGRFKKEETDTLAKLIVQLSDKLPDKGRLTYGFVPLEIKKEVDKISTYLFSMSAIKNEYQNYIQLNKDIMKTYSASKEKTKVKIEDAISDLNTRVGNQIIKTAKEFRNNRSQLADDILDDLFRDELSSSLKQEEPDNAFEDIFDPRDELSSARDQAAHDNSPEDISVSRDELSSALDQAAPDNAFENVSVSRDELSSVLDQAAPDNASENVSVSRDELSSALDQAAPDNAFENVSVSRDELSSVLDQAAPDNSPDDISDSRDELSSVLDQATPDNAPEDIFTIEWSKEFKSAMKILYNPSQKEYDKVLTLLEDEGNNVLALYELGNIHYKNFLQLPKEDSIQLSDSYYKKALEGFSQLVQKENQKTKKLIPYLHYRIGKMFEYGQGTEVNIEQSIKEYIQADGNKYALYRLGSIYQRGEKLPDDLADQTELNDRALKLFKRSAELENAYGSYAYAKLAESSYPNITPSEIAKYYREALDGFKDMHSKNKSPELAYKIGVMYFYGKGTEKDIEKAVEYFKSAKEFKNYFAEYMLGRIYIEDTSGMYNKDEGMVILKKLIESEDENIPLSLKGQASFAIGHFYFKDEEMRDYGKALKYLQIAADEGNDWASYDIARIHIDSSAVYYNANKGIEILLQLAKSKDVTNLTLKGQIMYTLGKSYLEDENVKNINSAVHWLKESAKLDNSFAHCKLGKIYSDEASNYYNRDLAFLHYKAAAVLDNDNGQYHYGKMLCENGDTDTGLKYLNMSMDNDNSAAAIELGSIYLFGKYGIQKDIEYGKELLERALAQGNEYAGKVMDFYDNYKDSAEASLVYSLCRNVFSAIGDLTWQKQQYMSTKQFRVKSKEMKKVLAKRQEKDHEQ